MRQIAAKLTANEVSDVVHAYVSSQLLAALLFAIFAAIVLTILGVPAEGQSSSTLPPLR